MRIRVVGFRAIGDNGMAEKASGGVQSVERVFELLELITDAGGDVTLSELSSSTTSLCPLSIASLRTLVSLGYIRQLPNRRYALGPRLIRLGEGPQELGALASPSSRRSWNASVKPPTWPSSIRTWSSTSPRRRPCTPCACSPRCRRRNARHRRREGDPGPARRRSGPRDRGPHRTSPTPHGQEHRGHRLPARGLALIRERGYFD